MKLEKGKLLSFLPEAIEIHSLRAIYFNMYTISKLYFLTVKILIFPLLLLCRPVLSVLVAWQRNDNSLFCEADFS